MHSKRNKIDDLFKKLNRQSKRKAYEVSIDVDLDVIASETYDEFHKKHIAYSKLNFTHLGTISAQDINSYIWSVIPAIESQIIEHVSKYPKYHWKFIISALPKDVYHGMINTTWLFTIQMVESCISFSKKLIDENELYKGGSVVIIEINKEFVEDYGKLIGLAKLLRDMYVIIRTSSKGSDFILDRENNDIKPLDYEDTLKSIALFDARNSIESRIPNDLSVPTRSGFSLNQHEFNSFSNKIIVAIDNPEPSFEYIPRTLKGGGKNRYTQINYTFSVINLETIFNDYEIKNGFFPWEIEFLEIICITSFITYMMINGWVFLPDIAMKGYVLMPKEFITINFQNYVKIFKDRLLEKFGINFEFNNGQEILNKYKTPLEKNIYPSNSSLVFDAGRMIGFDISTSMNLIFKSLEHTKKQGEIANLRGKFFEEQTQASINKTSASPHDVVKKIIGKKLIHNKKTITDLDSAMIIKNTLVIISCKSMILSDDYDKGEFKSIRNMTTAIEKYVVDWREKVTFFNDNRVGSNYDFSEFNDITGIVITPNVLYLNIKYRKEILNNGLFEQMSLLELERWLKTYS
ncbi:hypothetical protein ACK34X_11000 [Aeromonas veronii]